MQSCPRETEGSQKSRDVSRLSGGQVTRLVCCTGTTHSWHLQHRQVFTHQADCSDIIYIRHLCSTHQKRDAFRALKVVVML